MRVAFGFVAILALCLWGCASPGFNGGAAKGLLEGSPIDLSGEQVTLTDQQVECGVKNELWDPVSSNTAHLTQKGRDLRFSDDVRVSDPEIIRPYTQLRGSFPVSVSDVAKLRDAGSGLKLADVKLGAVVAHECFAAPLPIMGIRKGKFTPDFPVVFRFRGSEKDWAVDKLVH